MPYITQTVDILLMKKILSALFDLQGKYFAIWFSPDVDKNTLENILKSFKPYFITQKPLVPVTVYKDSLPESKTNLYVFNDKSIYELETHFFQLRKYADSISVYNSTYISIAYAIFLEDIVIIEDLPTVKNVLGKYMIEFSDIAPEGWEGRK